MRYTLVCDGVAWTGWQSFSVRQNMENVAHSFTFTTTDRFQEGLDRWNVRGGSKIEFFIDDEMIVSGFVRKYSPSINPERHSITIDGESAAVDIVDSSHLGPYFWKAGSAEQVIADVLKPFGLKLALDKKLKPIPKEGYRVGVNDTPFEIVRKLLERDQMLFFTDRNNNLVATDGRNPSNGGTIRRGDYVEIGADHDLSNSFSEIVVRAQKNERTKGDKKEDFDANQKIEKRLRNSAETRYRPVVFVNSGEPEAQAELAEDIKRRFSGDQITATCGLKTHLNKLGDVWGANQLVFLDEPLIYARQKLVVSEVEFTLDETSGFRTNLALKLPVAFDTDGASARDVRLGEDGPFTDILAAFIGAGRLI